MEILPDSFVPHWIEGLTSEKYHADRTAVSSSPLRKILKSPKTFRANFFRTEALEETPAMKTGTMLHMALLEPESYKKTYILIPEFKGKGSVSAREEWETSQRMDHPDAQFVKQDQLDEMEGMVNSVLSNTLACTLLKKGKAEMSGYYRDPGTGIKCRLRPDFMNLDLNAMVDVKTCRDCEEKPFIRHAIDLKYDFQFAMYMEGIELITGKPLDYAVFLAIEKVHPYEIALHEIKDEKVMRPFLSRGKIEYRKALDLLRNCIDDDKWPGYRENKITKLELPAWINLEE